MAAEEERHPRVLAVGDRLLGEEAHYYGQKGQVAGEVMEEKQEEGRRMLSVKLYGTTIDGLLLWGSQGEKVSRWHLCPAGGPMELEGEGLVHVTKSRKVEQADLEGVGWSTNLQAAVPPPGGVDENADLRDRMRRLEGRPAEEEGKRKDRSPKRGEGDKEKDRSRRRSVDRKAKKKKKKKKVQRSPSSSSGRRDRQAKKRRATRGSSPASAGGRKRSEKKEERSRERPSKKSSSSPSSSIGEGQVTQRRMFKNTALDLSSRVRKKVMRRAQRFMKKKKSSSSESGSSDSTGEGPLKTEQTGLFGDELRIRGVAERYPGLLAAEALRGIHRMVSSDMGDTMGQHRRWAPMLVRYYRQVLSRRISGAMGRELLTHCSLIDSLLEGKIAQALDISLQRIKGLELQAGGTNYQVSQRLEVLPSESNLLPSRQEMAIIQKERSQEAKAFGGTGFPAQTFQGKGKGPMREERPTYKGKDTKGKGKTKTEGKKAEEARKSS